MLFSWKKLVLEYQTLSFHRCTFRRDVSQRDYYIIATSWASPQKNKCNLFFIRFLRLDAPVVTRLPHCMLARKLRTPEKGTLYETNILEQYDPFKMNYAHW